MHNRAMRASPTASIEEELNLTPFHILVESTTKRMTCRMIEEGLVRRTPQPLEAEDTWHMSQGNLQ